MKREIIRVRTCSCPQGTLSPGEEKQEKPSEERKGREEVRRGRRAERMRDDQNSEQQRLTGENKVRNRTYTVPRSAEEGRPLLRRP